MRLRLIHILILSCAFSAKLCGQINSGDELSPKILIIDAYSIEVEWANSVCKQVESKVLETYPRADIHVGHLNIDGAFLLSIPQLALRSLLWAFVEDNNNTGQQVAESLALETIFSSGIYPDAIVFVGIDGLLFYQSYGYILKQWRDIPLILCTVNSRTTKDSWFSIYQHDDLIPVEERRTTKIFVPERQKSLVADSSAELVPCKKGDVSGYMLTQHYNLTGVKSSFPVKENLELISTLMPDLQEIMWVDNDYYSSKYIYKCVEEELEKNYPAIKLSTTKHNKINSDSIFCEILQAAPNRAFLTYAWSINGIYSKHSDMFMRDMFTERSSVPLFSLTEPSFNQNYWVGGYYAPSAQFAEKTVEQLTRILNGEPTDAIPFEVIEDNSLMLDQSLLKKYGLEQRALKKHSNVVYKNRPPSFFDKHEKKIFGTIAVLIIIGGVYLFLRMRNKQNRILKEEAERYKKLSDMLRIIYNYASTDFAVYDDYGACAFSNIDSENPEEEYEKLLPDNIFDSIFLTPEQKKWLLQNERINTEISIDSSDKFSSSFIDRNIYQLIIIPLKDNKYQYAHYLMLVVNKTPLMRERTERERFETLLDFASGFSNIGMAFYDLKTKSITATHSWYTNLDEPVNPDTLPTYKFVYPEDRASLLRFRERKERGSRESFIGDIRVRNEKGQLNWIREYLYPSPSNENVIIELNINVNQAKEEEKKLYEAKKRADLASEETKLFLSSINHEIRTPLNSIVGFSAFLALAEHNEEFDEYVEPVNKANMQLTNLMDDIILLSNLDSGRVEFSSDTVNLNVTFADWCKYCKTILFGKKLEIICDIPEDTEPIVTDFFYFSKLMLNLLINAIKFTETGSVTLGFRSESDYYFFVKDTGCGIDNVHQQLIFQRFTKLNTFAQGTGLGLALCKRIVEKFGGKIGMNSKPGEGSTFWFTIPK